MVAESRFDQAFMFIFSPRPGTRAAAMEDQFVPHEIIQERFDRLVALQGRISLELNTAMVGQGGRGAGRGAIEERTRKWPPPGPGEARWCTSLGGFRPGTFLDVLVTSAAPHHLIGHPV